VTESLCELGVGDRLVGITDYCLYPIDQVARVPRMGGTKNPDLSQVKAARPDLIIANQEENRKEDVEALRADGLKVWVTFPRTVREAIDVLWDIIRLFNVPRMGQTLVILEKSFEWASLAAENAAPVRVFCPIWRSPAAEPLRWWMTFNRETYTHDLLRVCGGENVFADRERRFPLAADLDGAATEAAETERDTRYPRVAPAEVVERAPDVILLPSEPYAFTGADVAAFEDFPEIPAVRHGRIHLVDGSLLTWHGTRLARALMELPSLLAADLHAGEAEPLR
jgi:ABC-type Fe3+-hydroxamate transport system substrate-binding protein